MAEVRIPTDQIPVDILERLQAILDGQSSTVPVSRGMGFIPTSALPHLTASTTSSSSYGMPAGVNVSNSMTLFDDTSSTSSPCKAPSQPVLSLSKLPSSKSLFSTTTVPYVSQTSSAKFAGIMSATSDEVDGGPLDSFSQFSGPSPQKRQMVEVLDDSDIVRVFPVEDANYDHKNNDEQTSKSQSTSEIVRIFQDVDTSKSIAHEATIIRALSPVTSHCSLATSRSENKHLVPNNRESSASSRTDWDYKPSKEIHSQLPRVSSSQGPVHQICDTSPRRPGSVSHILSGHYEFNNSSNKMATNNKSDASYTRKTSPTQIPRLHDLPKTSSKYVSDQEKPFSSHLISSFSVTARRSPELPTPPQTPDDGDLDMDDDEVFTYNVSGCEDMVYRSQASERKRKSLESTPRRSLVHLRHNSDRTGEPRQHLTNLPSSAGAVQKMSEMSFGDRHKTRKRLSFDEDMASQSPGQRPHHHSDPTTHLSTIVPLHCNPTTSSSHHAAATSRKCHTGPISSPSPIYHSHTMSSLQNVCRPSPNKHCVGMHQPASHQTIPEQKSQIKAPPMSPFLLAPNKFPVHDVFNMLERAVAQQASGPAPRARLHSDGDSISNGGSQNVSSRDMSSPTLEQFNTRRQTFSHGKRRRRDQEDAVRNEENATTHIPVTWSPDQSNGAAGDCGCSKIARNFLQMAEGAYRNISQMDGTQIGFGRFRQELTQTNNILRESLTIIQQFRAICEHNCRSMPESSATPAQR